MNYTFNEPFIKAMQSLMNELIVSSPGAIIEMGVMGGAIRDMLLNKPIKDIDILVHGNVNQDWLANNCKMSGKDYGTLTDFLVFNWITAKSDIPVQIVICNDHLTEVRDRFPCTLSMVELSWNGSITLTDSFRYAASNELLIFTDNCPEEYKERMHAKYPEYL